MARAKNTESFVYTNTHPNGARYVADCAYRAISIATGKDWLTVYDELTALGRELLTPPNDDRTVRVYLDEIGKRIQVKSAIARPTVLNVTKLDPEKVYVVKVASHLVAVKRGRARDTWDCTKRQIQVVWELY
jgi:hypothetical protein